MQCPSGGLQKVQATLQAVEGNGGIPEVALVINAVEAADALWETELVRSSGELVATSPAAGAPQALAAGRSTFGIDIVPADLAEGHYLLRVRFVLIDAAGVEGVSVAESFLEATPDGIDIIDSAEWFSRAGPVAVSDEEVADE